ncbi:hypothetical protein OIU76_002402 [Salix suchowensis]|nr:hypothetical protein OIU76_002402 [Salix suchowensis]
MMVLHRRFAFFQSVDDTLAVFHMHAVAGLLGGVLSGIFPKPPLLKLMFPDSTYHAGLIYSFSGGRHAGGFKQMGIQLLGAAFISAWNAGATSLICILISRTVDLRMKEDDQEIGDDAVHGEEAYARWGDGEWMPGPLRLHMHPRLPSFLPSADTASDISIKLPYITME